MFERFRDAINAALEAAAGSDPRAVVGQMRDAVIGARAAIEAMRQGISETELQLQSQRKQLADAERRGRLARGIHDEETAQIADRFAAKHGERVAILEEKLQAQRKELALAEREYEEMKTQLLEIERSRPATEAAQSVESAWRDLEAAGGTRPDTDLKDELLRQRLDRSAREAQADAQLEELKRKMGKR